MVLPLLVLLLATHCLAADEVIQKRLTALGGDGGVIAITPDGAMAWSFNSLGMYRARAARGSSAARG